MLGRHHHITQLEGCDFSPIYEHLMAEREAKKKLSKEVGKHCLARVPVVQAVSVCMQPEGRSKAWQAHSARQPICSAR